MRRQRMRPEDRDGHFTSDPECALYRGPYGRGEVVPSGRFCVICSIDRSTERIVRAIQRACS